MRGGRGGRQIQPKLRPIIKKNPASSTAAGSTARGAMNSASGCGSLAGGVTDCAYSVAQSTASLFSAGFTAHFERLFSFSSSLENHEKVLSEDEWNAKEALIRVTLAGNEAGNVDLWKLRELALSPGGLLTSFLRKQAWPKLLSCHEQVLAAAANTLPISNLVIPTSEDMRALKHDVSKTIWSVEQHIIASREQEQLVDNTMQHFLSIQKQRSTRVRFAPQTRDIVNEAGSKSPPSVTRIESIESQSPTAAGGGEVEDTAVPETISLKVEALEAATRDAGSGFGVEVAGDVDSFLSIDEDSIGGYCPSETTLSTNFTMSSRPVRWRKATVAEQKILYNVILSVLRTEAEPSEFFEDDRYHYFPGLQDLTALLMINLESPSLTSLVLAKLAGCHLRDAMRKDRIMIDTALAHSFMPLLASVDPELYGHLRRHGMALPTFCRQWIACWFSQDVPDAEVASRLLDAFLVGHPLLPLYAAVALMTNLRTQILSGGSRLSTLYSLLRGLPVQNLFEEDCRMVKAEKVIATALGYMKVTPPQALIDLISSKSDAPLALEAIAMFEEPPAWCFRSLAPSDYSLLSRAQELRSLANSGELKIPDEQPDLRPSSAGSVVHPDMSRSPLSYAALGCYAQPKRTPTLKSVTLSALVILGFAAAVYNAFTSLESVSIGVNHTWRQESAPFRVALRPIVNRDKSTSKVSPEQRGPILSMLPSKPEAVDSASNSDGLAAETVRQPRPLQDARSLRLASCFWLSALARVVEDASVAKLYAQLSGKG